MLLSVKRQNDLLKNSHHCKNEIRELGKQLAIAPKAGTPLGNHCYKIRLSIASKGKGKSGGARVITYLYVAGTTVFLLSIYDKSERNDISNKELLQLLKELPLLLYLFHPLTRLFVSHLLKMGWQLR